MSYSIDLEFNGNYRRHLNPVGSIRRAATIQTLGQKSPQNISAATFLQQFSGKNSESKWRLP